MNLLKTNLLVIFFLLYSCGKSPFLDDIKNGDNTKGLSTLEGGLHFKDSDYKLDAFWRTGPLLFDESKILVLVTNKQGSPINFSNEFRTKLWMPGMGHGSYPITVSNIAIGIYELSEVYFTMPGLWDIHFQHFDGDKLIEEVKWSLDL